MREIAIEMLMAGVKGADPEKLVQASISIEENTLKIKDESFDLDAYDKILLFGIGKSAVPMAKPFSKLRIDDGLIITNKKHMDSGDLKVNVKSGTHPFPSEKNIKHSKEIYDKVISAENSLIIFLVSGGGSSLYTLPDDDITLEDLVDLNEMMLESGANISEINTVRKHLSKVKGGRTAGLCSDGNQVVSLIISDVVGDVLTDVASGPTVADPSTYGEAVEIIKRYGLWDKVSESIRVHLSMGKGGEIEETPKSVEAKNFLIGSNMIALQNVKSVAESKELTNWLLTSENQGIATEVAKPMACIAVEIQKSGNPIKTPAALIIGGEMTVEMKKKWDKELKGGPNREFVLSFAQEIRGRDIVVASIDTDGVDGVGKSGAIADGMTIYRSSLNAEKALNEHQTERFFDELDDSIEFESNTNVNDISVVIVS